MRHKNSYDSGDFISYDDNNLTHVAAGPDYGQVDTGSKSMAWDEIHSKEYEDFVDYLTEKILDKKLNFIFS